MLMLRSRRLPKRWRFVSPLSGPRVYNDFDVYSPVDFDKLDLARFPEAAKVKVLDVVVEPGETMFLPLAWWRGHTLARRRRGDLCPVCGYDLRASPEDQSRYPLNYASRIGADRGH